jgi:hypothetical protein
VPVSGTLIAIGVVSLATAVIGVAAAARERRKRRHVAMVALTPIAAGSVGTVIRVIGRVRSSASQLVAGPYSGSSGIVAIGERWQTSVRGQRMRLLDRQVRAVPFVIEDDSGAAIVAVDHLDCVLRLAPAVVATSGPSRVFGAAVIAANLKANEETLEGLIKEGDRVTVIGMLRRDATGEPELFGTPKAQLVVSDDA